MRSSPTSSRCHRDSNLPGHVVLDTTNHDDRRIRRQSGRLSNRSTQTATNLADQRPAFTVAGLSLIRIRRSLSRCPQNVHDIIGTRLRFFA